MRTIRMALVIGCLVACAVAPVLAQIPDFNQLRTPESPAFVILGISPAQVSRPNTPAMFATSLLDNVGDFGAFKIPDNFAIETTPYWWFPQPALTLDDYATPGLSNLYRNLSLSIAVTDSAPGEVNTAGLRRVGFGMRTSLVPGKTLDNSCIARVQLAAAAASQAVGAKVAAELVRDPSIFEDLRRLERFRGEAYAAVLDELPEEQRRILVNETNSCVRKLSAKTGFQLDAATAVAFRFPDRAAADGRLTTLGMWASPAFSGRSFSAAGVVRLAWRDLQTDTTGTAFDLGFKGGVARDRYSVAVESVWRRLSRRDDAEGQFRLVGNVDVRVSGDTWLTLAFGRDYDAGEAGSLIALANIQWQFGSRSVRPSFD